jgi:hypothetical protein
MKEDDELIKFFEWVSWMSISTPELKAIFHVANERRTSIAHGVRLKRKGVRSGIPDVFCLIPNKDYHGLLMEFKTEKGKLSKTQSECLKLFHALGYCVRVPRSADEAISILKTYLSRSSVEMFSTES